MKQQDLRYIQLIPFGRHERYKVCISILFGLLGFIGAFYSIQFDYVDIKIIINWSLIFPLMVAMAWGKRYGCISIILGLTVLYPFYLGVGNGWACLVPALSLYIWIMILGFGAEKRIQVRKFYVNTYFLQFIYVIIHVLLYFTAFPFLYRFNPPFWYPDAYTIIDYGTIAVFAFKSIIVEFILLAVCDVLLLLSFVRKIFRFQRSKAARYNTGIVLGVTALGVLFSLIIMINNYFIIDGQHFFEWLLHPSIKVIMGLFLAGLFSFIFGGVLARIFQLQLETEETLKVGEAKYRSIFENINDLYTEVDINGTILTISPSVREVLGYEADELIGTNISNLYINPLQRFEMIKLILQEKEIKNYEIPLKDKNGHKHYMWLHAKIEDYDGGQQRIIVISRDVTQYMEAKAKQEESEKNYKLLFDKMMSRFFAIEPVFDESQKLQDIRIIDVNSEAVRHFGKKAGEILGKTWSEIYGYRDLNLEVYEKVFLTGLPQSFEVYYPNKHKYISANAFMINENKVGVIFEDITEKVKAQEELEQRVVERTAELQMAVSELEAFACTVSHDLKSPLRAIDAYSRIMLEDYPQQMEGEMEEIASNIKNISRDMIAMINKLLQYSTTARLDICKESVEINGIIRMIFDELSLATPERQIKLIMETELPRVKADKILLKQVIYNVISNAIKFTKTCDIAVIKVGHTIDKEEVVFYINDNGVGFDMRSSGKLFGIFQRLHSLDEYEGTGIGLATVRKIIQKHGGRTWIEGKPDQGATVYFTLPIIEEQLYE